MRGPCGESCGSVETTKEHVVSGSHAEEIVGDFFESDDWAEFENVESEPDLELPPLPPHEPEAA